MSFNGSGTFVINSAGQPVVANTVISATTFNALTSDLANGLSTCITKDGQSTPTANIPMGGFKITNLATGTAASDAATVAQIQSNGAALVTVTGTDTLTGTLTPALVAYVTGAVYYFVAPATNTGAVTLNIDTLGAKNVTRDGTTALVAGDIVSGEMVAVVYDGTRFQLISPVNSFTNLNVSGTLTVAGATTLNGNLQVGNAAADTVNFQASGWTLTNPVSITGTWADIGTITTADINGGTIDGTTIGGGTAAAGTFTTVGATTGNITTVNATTVDSTNLEVTNLKAKDGTAAGSIADSTGVVTLNSVVATTADINGGTIDATTIGGSSPAVGNFTTVSAASAVFTTATITTVNTTTLDLTNLEVTNIKAKDGTASMVVDDATGKVNVTTVSAASMNAAVAAVTTGSVTNLTATAASVASMNAGVALLTTATVTTLNASGASIASANIGNLQFTAASIASINAGVAVINNLTATSASIASANVGTAVITTGTLTNLTATSASVASANAAVALITTGTVTNLTATSASVASANVGTAVITGLTVTGASIASVNAGTATLSGNLTLSGGTANGVLYLNGSKVATSGTDLVFTSTGLGIGTSSPSTNLQIGSGTSNGLGIFLSRGATSNFFEAYDGTKTFISGTDSANGFVKVGSLSNHPVSIVQENGSAIYIDTSKNVGIGTTSPASGSGGGLTLGTTSSGKSLHVYSSSYASNGIANFYGTDGVMKLQMGALGASSAYIYANTGCSLALFSGGNQNATLDSSGNLGLGVVPSAWGSSFKALQVKGASFAAFSNTDLYQGANWYFTAGSTYAYINNGYATQYVQDQGKHLWFTAPSGTAGNAISFTQAMTLDASGNLGVGTTSPSARVHAGNASGTTPGILTYNAGNSAAITSYSAVAGLQLISYQSDSGSPFTKTSALVANSDGTVPSVMQFWTKANGDSSPSERARITSGGDLLVGNTASVQTSRAEFTSTSLTPAFLARVNVDADEGQWAGQFQKKTATSTTSQIFVRFLINDGATASGYITANGANAATFTSSSDSRLKENIAELPSQWGSIKALRPVEFDYIQSEGGGHQVGFIAQDFEQVYPDSVGERPDGMKMLSGWSKTEARMVKALQEAMARIEQLEAKVAALESK